MSKPVANPESGARPIHRPSADFHEIRLTPFHLPQQSWTRICNRNSDPVSFNRRQGNRFTPQDGPYSVLYVAQTARTCFLEIFGDEIYSEKSRLARSRWLSKAVVQLELPEVRVCNLTDEQTLSRIGLDKAALYFTDLSIPQSWAKAIMQHPAGFEGILYASRFGNGACLALFDCPHVKPLVSQSGNVDLHGSTAGEEIIKEFDIVLV